MAGVFLLIKGFILTSTFAWSLSSHDTEINNSLEKVSQWTFLAGNLILIPFIINYRIELRLLNAEQTTTSRNEFLNGLMAVLAFIICTLVFGMQTVTESYWLSDWGQEGRKETAQ